MTATLARRVTADVLVLVLAPVSHLVQGLAGYVPRTGPEVWAALLVGFSAPAWVYSALSDRSTRGATLGERLLGLRVTTTAGSRVGGPRAVPRTAAKLLPWELAHASAFALSSDLAVLTPQVVGLLTANVLALSYLGCAATTGATRASTTSPPLPKSDVPVDAVGPVPYLLPTFDFQETHASELPPRADPTRAPRGSPPREQDRRMT